MLRMLLVTGLLASMSLPVQAKDVSAQQAGVEYAREAMLKAEEEHQESLKKVSGSEKELAELQKKLADAKKAADASKAKLDQAKAKFEKAQATLDQAWKQ